MSVSGFGLAFGTSYNPSGGLDLGGTQPKDTKSISDIFVLISFIVAIGILIFSLIKSKMFNNLYMIGGFVGFILLLIFRFKTGSEVKDAGTQVIGVEYAIGYYLALLMFLICGILGIFGLKTKTPETIPAETTGAPPPAEPPPA
jgi:uncharacterized protein with PQ loop repeat